jgi:hypothetical protein
MLQRPQQPAEPADAPLHELFQVDGAGLVLAETVVERVGDPVQLQLVRTPPVRPVEKRTVLSTPVLWHRGPPFTSLRG